MVLALCLARGALIPAPALAATVPYFAENGSNEAMLSEMAIHPAALRVGDRIYLAYQGESYDPYVASYDVVTGEWDGPYRAGVTALRLDAHGAPSIWVDSAGRLHVAYGGHQNRLFHARSAAPGDISAWEELPYIDIAGTYPQTMTAPDGRVLLFYRSAANNWVMRTSDPSRGLFGEAQTILLSDSTALWYADFRLGRTGIVHAAFARVDRSEVSAGQRWGRHDAHYLFRDTAGQWHDATGADVATPVTVAATAQARVLDSGTDYVNEISVKEDDAGRPCLLFLTGDGAGPGAYDWRFMRHDGSVWTTATITTTDHFFDAGALRPVGDDEFEAFLVAGSNGADQGVGLSERGRGGAIERWRSTDAGANWSFEETITPAERGSDFADPQLVEDGDSSAYLAFIEWDSDPTAFFNRVYLWGDTGLVARTVDTGIERLGGATRTETAVAVSQAAFPGGADTVVLATQMNYPDALAGAPLARRSNAPLLLTDGRWLSSATAAEIVRLGAKKAIVLGGTGALSYQVEADLKAKAGVKRVERVAGDTRYETALEIARKMYDPGRLSGKAVVVSGENWPDAACSAPLAAALDAPVVLVKRNALPVSSASLLSEWETTATLVVGGSGVISDDLVASLPGPVRVGGADRYETSARVALHGLDLGLLPHRAVIATGLDFPDALTGGTLAARARGPVLLTRPGSLSQPAARYLEWVAGDLTRVWLTGQTDVLGAAVEEDVRTIAARGALP